MPIKMSTTIQSVVIEDFVYVGGGYTGNDRDDCTVMKFNTQRDEWTKLTQYSARYFAMISFASELVLVGGQDLVTKKPINQIALFASDQWTSPYPPMNTARHSSTAVCHKNYIIVVGGLADQYQRCTSFVEVLDVILKKWYIAEPLPNPRYQMKSISIEDTLYLMGGWDHNDLTKVVHKVDINDLITKAVSKQGPATLWQVTGDSPLKLSAPLNVEGSLLAVGGHDDHNHPSSFIYLYQPDTSKWVKAGCLHIARDSCTCSLLSNGEVIVAGGQGEHFSYFRYVDFLPFASQLTKSS